MKLSEYCDAINMQINVRRYSNQNERWVAGFEHCEIKEGGCLTSSYGSGHSCDGAIEDYIRKISGKRIVLNAYSDLRREFTVPMGLEL